MMRNKFLLNIVAIGILLILNITFWSSSIKLDLTEDKEYTLSTATKNILTELEEPVIIKAYFSEDLSAQYAKGRADFMALLIEYKNISSNNISFEFINPNKTEQLEIDALQEGIQPLLIQTTKKDQVQQQKAFMGAVLKNKSQEEVIPFVEPGSSMEYALTTAIKKVSNLEKLKIAFITGHGEPGIEYMLQSSSALSVLYEQQNLDIKSISEIDLSITTAIIVAPTDSFSSDDLEKFENYIEKGGNMVLALNVVNGNLQTSQGKEQKTGLENWIEKYGLKVNSNFIVDEKCGSVTQQQQEGFSTHNSQISFPYAPLIHNFADHPITNGLEGLLFQFISSIDISESGNKNILPLLYSSQRSGVKNSEIQFDLGKEWTDEDFAAPKQILAAYVSLSEQTGLGNGLVIIGDGDFAINGPRNNARQLNPDNVNLLVNSVDFLSDETGLIELRTRGISYRPLRTLDEGSVQLIKYLNLLGPLGIITLYGIFRLQKRKKRRRMLLSAGEFEKL